VQIATVTPPIEDDPTKPGVQTRHFDEQSARYTPIERETADIESLVESYLDYVRRLALSILDEPSEADDAVQETFLAAYRNLGRYRGESSLKTWLTSIAVNVCRGKLRKRKMQQTLQNALEALHILSPHEATPEREAIRNEASQRLWQAVDSLDEKHRLVIALRYVHELSVPEIAVALDVNEGTIHSRLHYARRKLQALLYDANPYAEAGDGSS
jgi:RNA polymerase sigma-70 factor (ECF subfamily)